MGRYKGRGGWGVGVRRGSGVGGRGGASGGASASGVRLKSKSASSEAAGEAMLNGLVSPQICAASVCGSLHLEAVEELTFRHATARQQEG